MATIHTTLRVPGDVIEEIDREAKERNTTRSDILRRILTRHADRARTTRQGKRKKTR